MTLLEWGSLSPDKLRPLYDREEQRWRAELDWDTRSTWNTIETGRSTWGLPGVVCCDRDSQIRGWMYFMRRDGRVDVGGIVSDSPAATSALLDRVDAHTPIGGFVYASAVDLQTALTARQVRAEPYAYLKRAIDRVPYRRPALGLRPWRRADLEATAALLREAYDTDRGRLFAPHNTIEEWRAYLDELLAFDGCGVLRPELSRAIDVAGRLVGVALISTLSATTAHLVQLVVSPSSRRGGVGQMLLAEALRAAHAMGYAQMSLIVSEQNHPALALYRSWGFAGESAFYALERRRVAANGL